VLVEGKFIGEATRVQDIQEEILADVPGYLREATGYSSLIVFVYDAAQKLRDTRRFVDDLRNVTGIIDVIVVTGVGVQVVRQLTNRCSRRLTSALVPRFSFKARLSGGVRAPATTGRL